MRLRTFCLLLGLSACALAQEDAKGAEAEARIRGLTARVEELVRAGKFVEARPLAEQALQVADKVLGADAPGTGMCLNNLAFVLQALGDLQGARPLFERALAIQEKSAGPDDPETATSLNNLAMLLQDMGDSKGARPLAERALAIDEKAHGPDATETGMGLNNLANVLQALGDLEHARSLYERALAISEKTRGPDHPDTARTLADLASLLQDMGDLKGARPLYERALAIDEKALGPDHPDTATCLNNLALLLQAMGDPRGARPLFERALGIFQKSLGLEHVDTAKGLGNLATVLQDLGDLKGARSLLERAVAIDEQALGPDHPDTAKAINDLAEAAKALGDTKEARRLFERALAIHQRALGKDHPDTAMSLNNLASLLQTTGDLQAARPLYERALAIWEKTVGANHPNTATGLNNLANLLQAAGHPQEARRLYERAWDCNKVFLHTLLPALSSRGRGAAVRERAVQLECYLQGLLDDPVKTYSAVLAWKGAALRANEATMRLPADASKEAVQAARDLAEARGELARLALSPPAQGADNRSIAERYEGVRTQAEDLERKLGEMFPDLAARALEVEVAEVQKALPEGAVLLETLENEGNLHAWVVRRDDVKYFSLGRAGETEPVARMFREALERDDEKAWKEAGAALRAKVEKPLADALKDTKKLYVSPDGALATLPWGLLPEGDRFLLERLPIVYVNGGAGLVLAARTKDGKRGEGLLALGDVDYEGVEGAPPRLPETRAEVKTVAALFKGGAAQTLTGKDASREAFERDAPKARYIHVATHGFFDLADLRVAVSGTRGFSGKMLAEPMETEASGRTQAGGWNPLLLSGIVLARTEKEGGVLTAEEMQSLDLRGVDLVVLSACETGRGELAAGEGVLGLSRALSIAGARGFMLSLWKVPDAETRELMEGFYTEFWGGPGAGGAREAGRAAPALPEEALRSKQLRMLARDREAKTFRPSAWGAWVLTH